MNVEVAAGSPPATSSLASAPGGSSLILLWWTFMLSGLLLILAVVLLGQALGFTGIVPLAVTVGVLAGLVQMLGPLRWVYLVPSLARSHELGARA